MIRSCNVTAFVMKCHLPSCILNDALQKSAIGCLQTTLSWILMDRAAVCRFEVETIVTGQQGLISADWFGYCHGVIPCSCLGEIFSSDLSLDKHVSSICAACFYWRCQLLRVRLSLHDEFTRTLVHDSVKARVDYCNMVLAGVTRSVADRLQRVLNATACLVSGMCKYDHGWTVAATDLHWLDVADWVRYKLAITVHRCLHNKAPQYLTDCCVAVSDIAGHQEIALSKPLPAGRTALSTNNTRPSVILCRWTNHLELALSRISPRVRVRVSVSIVYCPGIRFQTS